MPEKILLIEDKKRTRQSLQAVLEKEGFEVYCAAEGIEGVLAFNQHQPALVVLEQYLPRLSGEEVLIRLRQENPYLPLLLLASPRFGEIPEEISVLANQVLLKPIRSKELVQHIREELVGLDSPPLRQMEGYQSPQSFYELQGELAQDSFPALLAEIRQEQHTGVLTLELAEGVRHLAFREGLPFYAESRIPGEEFKALLLKRAPEVVDGPTFDQITAGAGGRALLQKKALVQAQILEESFLQPLLHYYTKELLIRSFAADKGSYFFIRDEIYLRRCEDQPLPLLYPIYQGLRRYRDPEPLLAEFEQAEGQECTPCPTCLQSLKELSAKIPKLELACDFELLQRRQPLEKLLHHLSPDRLQAVQLLKTLHLARQVALRRPPSAKPILFPSPNSELSLYPPLTQILSCPRQAETFPPSSPSEPPSSSDSIEITVESSELDALPPEEDPNSKDTPEVLPTVRRKKVVSVGPMRKNNRGDLSSYTPPGMEAVQTPTPPSGALSHLTTPSPSPNPFPENLPLPEVSSIPLPSDQLVLDEAFQQQINSDYLRVQSYDYFLVLNIPRDANLDEIQKAYLRLAGIYRPDRFTGQHIHAELRAKATEIFLKTSQAYGVLSDLSARRNHEKDLQAREDEIQVKNRIIHANMEYQRGEEFMKMEDYEEAAERFRQALEFNPREPAYYIQLGWALYNCADSDDRQILLAKGYLEQGIALNPIIEEGYLYLGNIRKAEGELIEAEDLFQQLQLLNPGSIEAQRELQEIRLLRQRNKRRPLSKG